MHSKLTRCNSSTVILSLLNVKFSATSLQNAKNKSQEKYKFCQTAPLKKQSLTSEIRYNRYNYRNTI